MTVTVPELWPYGVPEVRAAYAKIHMRPTRNAWYMLAVKKLCCPAMAVALALADEEGGAKFVKDEIDAEDLGALARRLKVTELALQGFLAGVDGTDHFNTPGRLKSSPEYEAGLWAGRDVAKDLWPEGVPG